MAEQPVKCGDCPKLVTPQTTWSDRNGNKGRLYVMVRVFSVPRLCYLYLSFSAKELRNNHIPSGSALLVN
jgi:hypothetical protein